MFGTQKRYELFLSSQKDLYEQRISELKDQNDFLRRQLLSATSATNIPIVQLEADAVMNQREEVIQISPEEMKEYEEVEQEASRILSGNY